MLRKQGWKCVLHIIRIPTIYYLLNWINITEDMNFQSVDNFLPKTNRKRNCGKWLARFDRSMHLHFIQVILAGSHDDKLKVKEEKLERTSPEMKKMMAKIFVCDATVDSMVEA